MLYAYLEMVTMKLQLNIFCEDRMFFNLLEVDRVSMETVYKVMIYIVGTCSGKD